MEIKFKMELPCEIHLRNSICSAFLYVKISIQIVQEVGNIFKRKDNRDAALLTLGLVVYLVSKSNSDVFSETNYLQKIIICFKEVIGKVIIALFILILSQSLNNTMRSNFTVI